MKKMISRRNFLTAAGVVAAAGVLTACGGSSSSNCRFFHCRIRCFR